jgi:hypothetical protein
MDPFALLGLPRQPWLDPAEVRAAFQRRSRQIHPDAATGDAAAFAELNAAQRLLAVPATRLRWLSGDVVVPAFPPDPELGFRVAALAREIDALLEKYRSAANPLARALHTRDLAAAGRGLDELQAALVVREADAESRARLLLAENRSAMAALAGEFTYLDRWQSQLRARALEMAIVAAPKSRIS